MNIRRLLSLGSVATIFLAAGCGGFLGSTGSSSAQQDLVTTARFLRLYQAYVTTVLTPLSTPNGTLQYDGNLYYKSVATSSTVTTVSYFTDSGGTNAAGTATITLTSAANASPATYSAAMSITLGNRPMTGTISISETGGLANSTSSGVITENSISGTFPINFTLTTTAGTTTGTVSGVSNGSTVTLAGLSITSPTANAYSLTSPISVQPANANGSITSTLNADYSGNAMLSDGSTITWLASGGATVNLPNVSGTINIASVDNGV